MLMLNGEPIQSSKKYLEGDTFSPALEVTSHSWPRTRHGAVFDDDPSGIATYSQAGAMYGYKLLWMIPFMYSLLLSVQGACSRIGAVTGKGLVELIKENYSKKMLFLALFLVVVANIVNIGADFGAMAATLQLLVPQVPFAVAVIASRC